MSDRLSMLIEKPGPEDVQDYRRGYLGYSGLNVECPRQVWYSFRFANGPVALPKKKRRIFERGDLEEARVIRDLKNAGIEVFKVINGKEMEMTGDPTEEQENVLGFAGHVAGHPDGRVRGVPLAGLENETLLLEIKTMSDSSYKKIKKLTVKRLKEYSRAYWGQIQAYMGRMGLKRTLYVCVNKNNEARYYDIIDFDKSEYEDLKRKEEHLVTSEKPPEREFPKGHFKCDYCPHIKTCHLNAPPRITCRSCKFLVLKDKGIFECGLSGKKLSLKEQLSACNRYSRMF